MTKRQKQIISELGFHNKVTDFVILELGTKTTNAANKVMSRLKKTKGYDEPFEIYSSESKFTVVSPFLITREEVRQFSQILNLNYIKLGTALDLGGLWQEWIKDQYN